MTNNCPICQKPSDSLKTAIKNGIYLTERCERCLNNFAINSVYARKFNRERDKRDHAKDIIQRFNGDKINPDFVDAYPEESRKQWGDDVLRDYGVKSKLY